MTRTPRYCALAALLLAGAAGAGLTVQVQPNPLFVGEAANYILVSDEGEPELTQLPDVPGITWQEGTGRSVDTRIVNGRRSDSVKVWYPFVPRQEGVLEIPRIPVKVGNRIQPGTPVRIAVHRREFQDSSGKKIEIDELIFMQVRFNGQPTPPAEIYLGQEIAVAIELFVAEDLQVHSNGFRQEYFPEPELENAIYRDFSAVNQYNSKFLFRSPASKQIVKGRRFDVYWYQMLISGLSSGAISGTISHKVPIIVPTSQQQRRRRNDLLDSFFNRQTGQVITHPVSVSVPPIQVKSVPRDEHAESGHFLGLIGNWQVDMSIDQAEIRVGEDVTLTLTIEGNGNIDSLVVPKIDHNLPGFKVFLPEVNKSMGALDGHSDKRVPNATVKWVIVPVNIDCRLPSFTFKTFDAGSGNYLSHTFQPQLKVNPPAAGVDVNVDIVDVARPRDVPTLSQARQARKAADILHIKTRLGPFRRLPLRQRASVPIGILGLLGPLLFLSLWWGAARRARLQGDESFRRRRQALKQRGEVLAAIRRASQEQLPDVVRQTVIPYLLAVRGLPPGTTISELRLQLDDDELTRIFEAAEAGGYMPGNSAAIDAKLLLRKVRQLAVFCAGLFVAATVSAADPDPGSDPFAAAAQAYESDRVDEAAQLYASLQRPGQGNAALLFNLGNCAYRTEAYSKAIAYYERARRLAPRDSDIVENLNFVRSQLDLPPVHLNDSPLALLRSLRDHQRPDEWLLTAAAMWFVFWLLLGLDRWRPGRWRWWSLVPALLLALSLTAYWTQQHSTYRGDLAVVIAANTPAYRLPSTTGDTPKTHFDAGEYVTIVERRTEWTRVRLDQAEGWVSNSAVIAIWE